MLPPSCQWGSKSPWRSTCSIISYKGVDLEWPCASTQTTGPHRILFVEDTGGNTSTAPDIGSVTNGQCRGGILRSFSVQSCAGGPGRRCSIIDSGPYLEDIKSETAPPFLVRACITSSHPTPRVFGAIGSAWSCPPGRWLPYLMLTPPYGGSHPKKPSQCWNSLPPAALSCRGAGRWTRRCIAGCNVTPNSELSPAARRQLEACRVRPVWLVGLDLEVGGVTL